MGLDTTVMLSEMTNFFDDVPSYISLCREWDLFAGKQAYTHRLFREFLINQNEFFISALNLSHLTSLSQKVQNSIYQLPELTFNKIRLNTQTPNVEDVNIAITRIYKEIQTLIKYSEECMHYIGILRHAINYLDCWKKSIYELIMDDSICSNCYVNQLKRKQMVPRMTSVAESSLKVLKTHQSTLSNAMEKVLRPRQNMLLRADSALRLLIKTAEIEKAPGWIASDTIPSHKSSDVSGFKVESL